MMCLNECLSIEFLTLSTLRSIIKDGSVYHEKRTLSEKVHYEAGISVR